MSDNWSAGRPSRSLTKGPWIVAGAIVAAACLVSLTIILTRGGETEAPGVALDTTLPGSDLIVEAQIRAQDRAAQSVLRNALVAAKTLYTDNSSYLSATTAGLASVEPSLCYVDQATPSSSTDPACYGAISVSVFTSDDAWAAAVMSNSGTCFWIRDDLTFGTAYGTGSPCTGEAATAAAQSTW
jgi:hypothetical protein